MLQYPGFDPIAFELGPLKVRWYGITYLVGFAAGWALARYRAKQPGSTWKAADIDDLVFYIMLGVMLGGRIGYVLIYGLGYWADDPWYPLKVTDGGMSFHGGLIGTLLAMSFYAWRRGRRVADVFDFASPMAGIGLFAGRIGNFINGELWGKPTDVPWAFVVNGEARHPSQLYEGFLEGLVLFAVMWWFTSSARPRLAPSGLFLVLYGVSRFTLEFWRVPDEQIGYLAGGWFTMGQALSLPMVLIGIGLLTIAYRRRAPSGNFATVL